MRARADAKGYVELRGSTWWLRRWITVADPVSGDLARQYRREKLGSIKDLRTRAAARAAADEWIERTRPEPLAPGPQLLAVSYLKRFDKHHIPALRPTSQAVYRSVIRRHVAPAVAGLRLVDLDTAWLNRFLIARATMHRKTLLNIRSVILRILAAAVKDQYGACRISTRDLQMPRAAKLAKPHRYFTRAELELILNGSEYPWRCLWAVMGYAALRAGEALALKWSDVHFDKRLITVERNAVRGEVGLPKTAASQADVPMLPALQAELAEYLQVCSHELNDAAPAGLLFKTRTGKPYLTDDVRRRHLQPLLKRLGLPKAGLHAFRHSVPRMLDEAGVSVQTIRQIMRHRTTEQTEVYLHRRLDDVWANLEKAGIGRAE